MDDAAAGRAVIACANSTLAARSARIEIRVDTEFILLKQRERRRPGPLGRLARLAAKAAYQRIAPGADAAGLRDAFMHVLGEGFVEHDLTVEHFINQGFQSGAHRHGGSLRKFEL